MIHIVRANIPGFRSPEFTPGLNIVVADRARKSTARDTRNGLGKTTLLDIIRFCLGEDKQSLHIMQAEELQEWVFEIELCHQQQFVTVERTVKRPGRVNLRAASDWLNEHIVSHKAVLDTDKPTLLDAESGSCWVDAKAWKHVLSKLWYGLQPDNAAEFQPVFNDLIKYELRRDVFNEPIKCRAHQRVRSIQLSNAFLLNLNWQLVSQWYELQRRESAVKKQESTMKGYIEQLSATNMSMGELMPERDRLQDQVDRVTEQLNLFKVHPQFVEIEKEANDLDVEIQDLANNAMQLERLISYHDRSTKMEKSAAGRTVIELYESAGASLSDATVKRLEDVQAFHLQITRNRREYLRDERERLEHELAENRQKSEQLTNRRAALLNIINTHGAVDKHTQLHLLQAEKSEKLNNINSLLESWNLVEDESSEIRISRLELNRKARDDLNNSESARLTRGIFNSNSQELYEAPGDLIVNADREDCYEFRVEIRRSGSAGIDRMKTWCYDLMRAELLAKRNMGPGFLIHDSDIFADVDERQVARALELAERKSRECGFQYIVCLNSDKIPRHDEFSDSFNINEYVRLTLTDDTPAGSLLGMRF